MGFDKNTIIGFSLIAVLLVAMFTLNEKGRKASLAEQKKIDDSLALLKPKPDTTQLKKVDSLAVAAQQGAFKNTQAAANIVSVENEVIKIDFSTKGAQPTNVTLKKYKQPDSSNVILQKGNFNELSYAVNTGSNQVAETKNLNFIAQPVVKNADGSTSISFVAGDSTGASSITHTYTLRPNDYLVDFNIATKGANIFSGNVINLQWKTEAPLIEKDSKYELTQSHICFVEDNEYDFEYAQKGDSKTFEKLNWLAVKQQFFASTLIAKNNFTSASVEWKTGADSSKYIFQTTGNFKLNADASGNTALQLFSGPSDYNLLKNYNNKLEQIVPYGTGPFAFVKYINRHFLLPVFNFLAKNIASMGIVILLITLLIRLITSPILYKSYLNGAKSKVLKPELDALKLKHTDKNGVLDQQTYGMEQMKLLSSAGASPLNGCLPALLQIPIFMSLYYFFQSNIDLRGKNFLWANDLAQYDSIYKLPFNVPFYGDHVSLFTLTAVVTSLLISLYSMSNMQDNSNPLMKYMPYIFPVILLGVFNNLPAALTWYYTVSNTITLLLQMFIQKFVIKPEKVLAQINEKRKQPQKTSGFAQRIAAMQEQQRKMQEMKNKANQNKK
jgi:YidC/Oxa1 family membrane protein insertase